MNGKRLRRHALAAATVASLLVVAAASGSAPVGRLEPSQGLPSWKGHDWLVKCSALLQQRFVGSSDSVCRDGTVYFRDIKVVLDQAGAWLERLGFAGPRISPDLDAAHHVANDPSFASGDWGPIASESDPRCADRYCAWLMFLAGKHGAYSWNDQSLVFDPFNLLPDGTFQPGMDEGFGYTEVHELFHAVQASYPSTRAALDAEFVEWILEGTAVAIEHAAGASLRNLSTPAGNWYRLYDEPLHVPGTTDRGSPAFRSWAYGSSEFFDFLGEALNSPGRVQYLHDVLHRLRPDGLNGLKAVEEALQAHGQSLYGMYPDFVRRRLDSHCYFRPLGARSPAGDCRPGSPNEYRFALPMPGNTATTTVTRDHTLEDLAAAGYVVSVDVPQGRLATLTVRVPPASDADYLHLVVGGERYDAAQAGRARNEFRTILGAGAHELFVKLANAPRDLSSVEGGTMDFSGKPAPLEFRLEETSGEVTFSGAVSGSYAIQRRRPVAFAVTAARPRGCAFIVQLSSDDGRDYVEIGGTLPAPLAPGRVALSTSQPVTLVSRPSCGRPDVAGQCALGPARAFSETGTLELTQVTPDIIEARFHAQVSSMGTRVGPHVVEGHFVARPGGWVGASRREDHPCYPR